MVFANVCAVNMLSHYSQIWVSTPLELQKGKTAIEVGKLEALPAAIKMLMQAINAGELDDEIGLAANARKPQLKERAA